MIATARHVEAYGENGEFGWEHPCLPEDQTLYVSKIDAIWAGLEALGGYLLREGFGGQA